MRRSSRPAERGSFKPKRDAKSTRRPARRFDTLSLLSPRLLARIERARVAAIPTPLLQLTIERARVASSHHPVRVPAVSLPAPTRARIERARVASYRFTPVLYPALWLASSVPALRLAPAPPCSLRALDALDLGYCGIAFDIGDGQFPPARTLEA